MCICLVLIPFIAMGILLVGLYFKVKNQHWFKHLKKPKWTPPEWVLAGAWAVIYACLGPASYIVWEHYAGAGAWIIYALNLSCGWAIIIASYGLRNLKLTFILMVFLSVFALVNAIVFGLINYVAGLLFIPELLNQVINVPTIYEIWRLNSQA